MKFSIQKPRFFLNPLLSRQSIDKNSFAKFEAFLSDYQIKLAEQIVGKQSEPNIVTNALKPFIDSLGYNSQAHSQNGQSGIDLAIVKDGKPAVIIEAKLPNSKDMISCEELNRKAFHEAVLYFMRERDKGNLALAHIVITDFYNWFIFDAKDFDRLLWRNSSIKKIYDTHKNPTLLGSTTVEFYQLLELELPKIKKDLLDPELLDCAYFNLHQSCSDKDKIALYKLLSPDCLLKEFNPNDANSLNREFYNELLYILGLEESKEGGKKIIRKAINYQYGTLYENISNKLGQYNKPNDFESVIKLIIIWVNRILFLKLLESQIVKWTGNQQFKFLSPDKLDQYDALETLFFEVLAKPVNQRKIHIFDHVPYLNSSLFEIHPDENNGIKLSNLVDGIEIDYYSKTVVKDTKNQRKTGKVSTLPYLLAFLDAYDFANDSDEELVSQSKSLISASVLGLIFEKINGYKDGSFYTPSFITMYMARETITKTVIDKFNAAYGWQCKNLTDIHNKDPGISEANALINSIKICDPAVGSGHFLVSALNEILRIKSELGVLVSEDGKRIKDYTLSVENDDLIIKSLDGDFFEYKKNNSEKTRIQKTLFKEKQLLIENCLFGVDINPNSVNICRLRLWIELLKNAYYKDDGQLDTLPNIDINIKCGNSLISRFGLTDDLNSKTIKSEIADYKLKVAQYKENIGSKLDVIQSIEAIKQKIQSNLKASHQVTKKLNDALSQYVVKFSFDGLNSQLKLKAIEDLKLFGKQSSFLDENIDHAQKAKFKKTLDVSWSAVEEMESGKIYQNAFEWRFEFPEVLNDKGEYIGFDVVIGNPPYGVKYTEQEKTHVLQQYELAEDIYTTFIELSGKISSVGATAGLITPITWLTGSKFVKTRMSLLGEFSLLKAINLPYDIFADAYVDTGLYFFKNEAVETSLVFEFEPKANINLLDLDKIPFNRCSRLEWGAKDDKKINLNEGDNSIFRKVDAVIERLENHSITARGILANKEDYTNKTIYTNKLKKVFIGQLNRYSMESDFCAIEYGANLKEKPKSYDFFVGKRILVRRIISRQFRIMATLTTEEFVCKKDIYIVKLTNEKLSYEYILALLNSKLISYYKTKNSGAAKKDDFTQITLGDIRQLPIPNIELALQQPFVEKTTSIISAKQNNTDTSQLEAELDSMVYALYGLNDDEIKLIESS